MTDLIVWFGAELLIVTALVTLAVAVYLMTDGAA